MHRTRIAVARSRFALADVAMRASLDGPFDDQAALAVVNGGFFDAQHQPMGLAVSAGRTLNPLLPTMIGGVFWIRDGVAHLSASENYAEGVVEFAVQCKPRLVVASRRNIRTDDGKRAARTVLCLRDGGATVDVILTYAFEDAHAGPTLFELATELVTEGCQEALALDGGPSTGGVLHGAADVRVPLRGPIRHAVVITPR